MRVYLNIHNSAKDNVEINYNAYGSSLVNGLDIVVSDFVKRDECSMLYKSISVLDKKNKLEIL